METPNGIKKGIECCFCDYSERKCEECPYAKNGEDTLTCEVQLGEDALAYIRHLEEQTDYWSLQFAKQSRELEEYKAELLQHVLQVKESIPKWISVEERLPKAYSTVLVAYKDAYGETNVGAGILCNYADWVGRGFAMARDAVTHWMPLPEPPKEEC